MCRIIPPSLPPLMCKWLHHVALLSVHPGRAGVPLKAAAASQDSLGAWGPCWAGWHLYTLAARPHITHNLHGAGAIFAGRRGGQQQQARQGLQRRSCRPMAGHPHTLLQRQRAAQRSPCAGEFFRQRPFFSLLSGCIAKNLIQLCCIGALCTHGTLQQTRSLMAAPYIAAGGQRREGRRATEWRRLCPEAGPQAARARLGGCAAIPQVLPPGPRPGDELNPLTSQLYSAADLRLALTSAMRTALCRP